MLTRPTHQPPTTSRKARAAYNRLGPRISSQEARRRERDEELGRRAVRARDAERRRRDAKRRRLEREARERQHLNSKIQTPRTPQQGQCSLEAFVRIAKANVREQHNPPPAKGGGGTGDDDNNEIHGPNDPPIKTESTSIAHSERDEVKHGNDRASDSEDELWADPDLDDDSLLSAVSQ